MIIQTGKYDYIVYREGQTKEFTLPRPPVGIEPPEYINLNISPPVRISESVGTFPVQPPPVCAA